MQIETLIVVVGFNFTAIANVTTAALILSVAHTCCRVSPEES